MANERGFPVGKVNFLHMHPLTFLEFLSATGRAKLRTYLTEYNSFEPLPDSLHAELMEILQYYFFVGGMPEAVNAYVQHKDFKAVRDIQLDILNAYKRDFAKHAPIQQVEKINVVWQQVRTQLAKENKKFIFSAIKSSARGREYEESIQWLLDAGLIYKSHHISKPGLPLDGYVDHNIFKLFLLDVGLLGAQNNLSAKTIIEGDQLFTEYKGSLTENFVAQQLVSEQGYGLYYWTSNGTAEVDFIIEAEQKIYPLEVKAGQSRKKKSLLIYGEKYPNSVLLRINLMNLKHDGNIYNYPLYLVGRVPLLDGDYIEDGGQSD